MGNEGAFGVKLSKEIRKIGWEKFESEREARLKDSGRCGSRCIHISLGHGSVRAQITLPTSFREVANACSPERVFTYSFKGYFSIHAFLHGIFPKNIPRFGESSRRKSFQGFFPMNFKIVSSISIVPVFLLFSMMDFVMDFSNAILCND